MGKRIVDGYLVVSGAHACGEQAWPELHLEPEDGGDTLIKRINNKFRTLKEAHAAANEALQCLRQITEDGELIFSQSS